MSNNRFRRIKILTLTSKAQGGFDQIKKSAAIDNISDLLAGKIVLSEDSKFSSDKELVKFVQEKLIEAGFELPEHGADGILGKETNIAIKEAQDYIVQNKLLPSGLVIPGTVDYLFINAIGKILPLSREQKIKTLNGEGISKELDKKTPNGDVLYIGSSSLLGPLGKSIQSIVGPGKVFGKVGSQPSHWTGSEWPLVYDAISDNPRKIVILTGGNGISGAQNLISKIVESLEDFGFEDTQIVWIGSNPFGADNFDSSGRPYKTNTSYEYLKSPSSFEKANAQRKEWNSSLRGIVESAGGTFVDPFDYLKLKDGSPGFTCTSCDGVHLPQDVAQELASEISGLL